MIYKEEIENTVQSAVVCLDEVLAYWYDAFGIQPGDAMYVAPENRVRVW